jgi:hypothetical protein
MVPRRAHGIGGSYRLVLAWACIPAEDPHHTQPRLARGQRTDRPIVPQVSRFGGGSHAHETGPRATAATSVPRPHRRTRFDPDVPADGQTANYVVGYRMRRAARQTTTYDHLQGLPEGNVTASCTHSDTQTHRACAAAHGGTYVSGRTGSMDPVSIVTTSYQTVRPLSIARWRGFSCPVPRVL